MQVIEFQEWLDLNEEELDFLYIVHKPCNPKEWVREIYNSKDYCYLEYSELVWFMVDNKPKTFWQMPIELKEQICR